MQEIIQNIQSPESSAIKDLLLKFIVPLIVGLSAVYWGHILSKSLIIKSIQTERFFDAAFKFKKTFFETIEFLREKVTFTDDLTDTDTIQYTNDVISKALSIQRQAMWEFRELLIKEKDRLGFQNAWNEYTGQDQWDELRKYLDEYFIVANLVKYSINKSDPKEEIAMRKLAFELIEKLFEFTKLKYCK